MAAATCPAVRSRVVGDPAHKIRASPPARAEPAGSRDTPGRPDHHRPTMGGPDPVVRAPTRRRNTATASIRRSRFARIWLKTHLPARRRRRIVNEHGAHVHRQRPCSPDRPTRRPGFLSCSMDLPDHWSCRQRGCPRGGEIGDGTHDMIIANSGWAPRVAARLGPGAPTAVGGGQSLALKPHRGPKPRSIISAPRDSVFGPGGEAAGQNRPNSGPARQPVIDVSARSRSSRANRPDFRPRDSVSIAQGVTASSKIAIDAVEFDENPRNFGFVAA